MSRGLPWKFIFAGVLASAATGFLVFEQAVSSSSGSSFEPVSAVQNMAALQDPSTLVLASSLPVGLTKLPDATLPDSTAVHALLSEGTYTAYAWIDGGRVCAQDSNGNGGCLSQFVEPVAWNIGDPDELGSGAPLQVTGQVPDQVVGVDVIVNGVSHAAFIKNNALYYQLSDPTVYPDEIQGFVVRYSDGSSEKLAHDVVLPSSLKN